MKGSRLNINILIILAVFTGVSMAVLSFAPSWSQFAGTKNDPMLYATLFCISSAFMISSFTHPDKQRYIGFGFRWKHFNRLTAYFFGGVIAFSVNNDTGWVETAHLVFTALAIGTGYIGLVLYPESKKGNRWSWFGFAFGILGFFAGYIFGLWSIAWGEVLAAIPLAAQMSITLNFRK